MSTKYPDTRLNVFQIKQTFPYKEYEKIINKKNKKN